MRLAIVDELSVADRAPAELRRLLGIESNLLVAVIGSGIMASRLSPDDVGLQLLENAAATATALIGPILAHANTTMRTGSIAHNTADALAVIRPSPARPKA